ncbi:CU044_2847 family protein [Streptomyces lavendulae]|uniref:CU044_2847 family protein n=1 Tax=Streptomyces lavendulae TaxID=1914 RepID=UPI0036E61B94
METTAGIEGPVKAGRIGDAVREVPQTLQEALEPVTRVAQVALDQLRKARPDQITDLAVEAGAVITKSRANCHPQVSASWQNDDG